MLVVWPMEDTMSVVPSLVPVRHHLVERIESTLTRPALWIGLVVASSFVARLAAAWRHTSPRTFPDEYLYPAVARSLSSGQGFTIRGTPAHFPALLEPVLTAPIWLLHDTEMAFRLTQALHVAAMSSAAIPIYWLARRVGAPTWQALCCGGLTVAVPSLVLSSAMTADAIAYPLALGALAVGVATLERPSRANQFVFVALSGLATLARIQYIVIPVAFAIAVATLEGRHPIAGARRFAVVLGLLLTGSIAVLLAGTTRALGYYHGIAGFGVDLRSLAHWGGVDMMLLAFVAGVAIVPGAIAGLAAGLRRGAPRAHRAFAALATGFSALVLLEAAFYASNGSPRFQERYLIAIVPLLPVAFCAGARALPSGRWIATGTASVLIVLAMRVPLSGYAALDGKQDSPFLTAVARSQELIGIGNAGLLFALAVGALGCVAVLAALRPTVGVPLALAGAILAASAASIGATSFDLRSAQRMEATYADDGRWNWVDNAGLGTSSVLVTPGADRTGAEVDLFWNRDVKRVLRMPNAPEIDAFGDTLTTIADDGRLVSDGVPVRGPLLVEHSFASVVLDDAQKVRGTASATLWQPRGDAHIAMLTIGRYVDGWLDPKTEITVWPRRTGARNGAVELRLSLPSELELPRAVLQLTAPGFSRIISVDPGRHVSVRVPVHVRAEPVRILVRGRTAIADGDRVIVAQAEAPSFVPSRP